MLYHLLYSFHEAYGWLNVFRYQTFRAMLAFLLTFILVLIFQPVFIGRLRELGIRGQPIRDDGPKVHETKKGTPTMGGVVIVGSVLLSTLLLADLTNLYIWLTLIVMLAFAAVGFVDDWRKITQQNSAGLSEKLKISWQIIIAAIAGIILLSIGFSSNLTFPFFKEIIFPLGVFFIPFVILVVIGTSNAVNLTDGLDGLAIGPVMTVAVTYAIFAYLGGHIKLAEYLQIPYIPGVGELTVILASIFAAGLGFLWYNTFPAQVFMGDIGSLSLGGTLGFIAVLVKQELVLIVAGGVFVVEALSVLIQRYYYKMTKKRVFRMAPVHHHFELKGWAEPKIIVRFWIVSIVLALLSLTTL
ncbi:MAG: phospho-N-acetylmuramoyl-pentapeptide-transferase, partial [Bdellovibrionales bacterium]|nr:phospho-N-acetylmuramoyl-pentapeptide-transferase [Bdellovibrionales bacterium]